MDDFTLVGARPQAAPPQHATEPWHKDLPIVSMLLLALIVLGCLLCDVFLTKDPGYVDLSRSSAAPDREFLLRQRHDGTRYFFDDLVRRQAVAVHRHLCDASVDCHCRLLRQSQRLRGRKARCVFHACVNEIFISIPNLLLIVLLQAILGKASALSLSIVIGLTSWMSICQGRARQEVPACCAAAKISWSGVALHGRKLFSHSARASRAQFPAVDSVHGDYERARRNPSRSRR